MCGQKEAKKLNSVPLSARIVKERISILAENVKEQLDETTDFSSNSQLMVYVRYKGANNFEEELLFCSPLELRSRGIDVYNKVNEYFNAQSLKWVNEYFNAQSLKWENCISVSLDGAPAMLGHITGFSAFFSDYFPDLDTRTVSWIVDPFKCEIAMIPEEPLGLAEAILELRSNTETRIQFESKPNLELRSNTETRIQFESKPNLSSFWMSKVAKAFKTAHEEALKKLLPFGTTYLCEQGFSTRMNLKTKNRNRLNAKDCIQIALTMNK
ncbi:hypothetical protein QE152_g24266 [Popillia japonica]|uniref:Uncharacterized protein n=1 Tax=Popillia japonica TaxID=7064 RepID=A0AAW1KG52_POPJA